MWREIKQIIHQSRKFLIATHVNPDGDGLGAACAMVDLLKKMGKDPIFLTEEPIPDKFDFLDYQGAQAIFDRKRSYDADVLIVLDAHHKDRIGSIAEVTKHPNITSICIDHHPVSQSFTPHLAIDIQACSVGSMVYTLYKEFGYDLSLQAATGIYASILCDTGRFSYASTNRKAHKIADECMKLGVDPDQMYSDIYEHIELPQFQVLVRAMQRMELHFENCLILHTTKLEDYQTYSMEIQEMDLVYIHEFTKLVEGVQVVVILQELEGSKVRLSVRSKKNHDVGMVMRRLGGGGHAKAAGAMLEGSLDEVKKIVLAEMAKELMF